MGPLVVLGIGNVLLSDDGVGVHVVRALAGGDAGAGDPVPAGPPAGGDGLTDRDRAADGAGLPPGTEIVDGGTGGLALLPVVREAGRLVLVDAVDVGADPGSVHVLTGDDLYSRLVRLSVHQVGASDLLAAARLTGALPERVVLVGVQPASLEPEVGLSPPVLAALPAAIDAVRAWCHRFAEPAGTQEQAESREVA